MLLTSEAGWSREEYERSMRGLEGDINILVELFTLSKKACRTLAIALEAPIVPLCHCAYQCISVEVWGACSFPNLPYGVCHICLK